jgi:putative SOS response-associated peptidase YedK
MAGLWAEWRPERTQTGLDAFGGGAGPEPGTEVVSTYAVVTTEPNGLVERLHDRMSVVLPRGAEERWLSAGADGLDDLLAPYPAGEMRAYPVSQAVNDPSNDSPAVVEPVETDSGS